ncbi:MAG: 30S ribosomal protein S27ae [Candidatus Bathyarchaeia archaeon]
MPREELREKEAKEKRRSKVKIHSFYALQGKGIKRIREFCPKCGPGYFLAEHSDRLVCGNCGHTLPKPERQPDA